MVFLRSRRLLSGSVGSESLHELGRAFDKDHGSIQFLLFKLGGIAPAVRQRSQRTLTLTEREDTSHAACFRFIDAENSQKSPAASFNGKPGP